MSTRSHAQQMRSHSFTKGGRLLLAHYKRWTGKRQGERVEWLWFLPPQVAYLRLQELTLRALRRPSTSVLAGSSMLSPMAASAAYHSSVGLLLGQLMVSKSSPAALLSKSANIEIYVRCAFLRSYAKTPIFAPIGVLHVAPTPSRCLCRLAPPVQPTA